MRTELELECMETNGRIYAVLTGAGREDLIRLSKSVHGRIYEALRQRVTRSFERDMLDLIAGHKVQLDALRERVSEQRVRAERAESSLMAYQEREAALSQWLDRNIMRATISNLEDVLLGKIAAIRGALR